MNAPGVLQRLSAGAVFVALALAASLVLRQGPPPAALADKELAALESRLAAEGRLHPAATVAAVPGPAAFCAECHPLPPHGGTSVAAGMANAHSVTMDCLLCHWSAASGPRPAPVWNAAGAAVAFLSVVPAAQVSPQELGRLRAAVTSSRRCFERGPGCRGCHRPGGITPLLRPGSAVGRASALESLGSYLALAPGEKWYFPQLQ